MLTGLFHKAIAMSGSATAAWAVNRDPLYLARELAQRIDCKQSSTPQQIYDCVRSTCPQNMADKAAQIRVNTSLYLIPDFSGGYCYSCRVVQLPI